METDLIKILESLSPNERKILNYLEKPINEIASLSGLEKTSVIRALEYLQNKKIVSLSQKKRKIIEIGTNGAYYIKNGLPERRLLNTLYKKRVLSLQEAKALSNLTDEEFKASLGVLKRKALIELKNGKIHFKADKKEISKKTLEEQFLESLPLTLDSLKPEQLYAFEELKKRKDIVILREEKDLTVKITQLGKKILKSKIKVGNLIETITPEMIKKESSWKGKKFRRYDINSPLPEIYGGKRHFVNQALDYVRKIWTELGFKEMDGNMIESSFWIFDALFTAQDHPVREMQDTFFINIESDLPNPELVKKIKETHEKGVDGSKGWRYKWDEEEAKKTCLRTHTTGLSAQTLYRLSKLPIEKRRGKFFALGKNFRNETVDWSHGFEFYQTEGIVIDEKVTFRHLLGYLKQFYKKMGFQKVRFRPAYFPYTEPSVEIDVWHPEKKVWLELGGAGIFRPEITIPLLGKKIPVLAWGQGVDRIIMDYYKIKDLRELYKNDLNQIRKIKSWVKE